MTVGGVLLLITAARLKGRNLDQVNIKTPAILGGVVILIAELFWIIAVSLMFPMGRILPLPGATFWNFAGMTLHSPGFGVIGGFLAAGISFIAAGAAHYYSKERKVKIPEKKEVVPTIKEPTPSETPELKFCPECGAEIEDPNIKFCGKCGFEFKAPELAPL